MHRHSQWKSKADCRWFIKRHTFLLSVPPHQRQLAYNNTVHGRSQHISVGFAEVGHLALFPLIVRIVLIIRTILLHTTYT